jgi:hypothetical protein
MRRSTRALVTGLSAAAALVASAGTPAWASGATVVRDGGQCLTTDSAGDSWFFSCNFTLVFAPSGVVTQRITGSVIPGISSPLPSEAVTTVTGGPCLILDGQVLTTVVAGVVAPSGQVQLTCKS